VLRSRFLIDANHRSCAEQHVLVSAGRPLCPCALHRVSLPVGLSNLGKKHYMRSSD
jgi:hypothetical protein